MANHKFRRNRNQRAGCKLCKPWKINGNHNGWSGKYAASDYRKLQSSIEEGLDDYYEDQEDSEAYIGYTPQEEWIDNVLPWLIEYNVK